jgi:Gluconate 2-dehydrogenase subunit 3
VAISAQHLNSISSYRTSDPPVRSRLQQLIDTGAVYVAQNLSHSQFATLQAIAGRIFRRRNPKHLAAQLDAGLATDSSEALSSTTLQPLAIDYQLGLDELDTIVRTRTGYAFAELTTDLQDAILELVATRDLTTGKLDLARWLEEFHSNAEAAIS